jgi:hypothetical protein
MDVLIAYHRRVCRWKIYDMSNMSRYEHASITTWLTTTRACLATMIYRCEQIWAIRAIRACRTKTWACSGDNDEQIWANRVDTWSKYEQLWACFRRQRESMLRRQWWADTWADMSNCEQRWAYRLSTWACFDYNERVQRRWWADVSQMIHQQFREHAYQTWVEEEATVVSMLFLNFPDIFSSRWSIFIGKSFFHLSDSSSAYLISFFFSFF